MSVLLISCFIEVNGCFEVSLKVVERRCFSFAEITSSENLYKVVFLKGRILW